MNENGTLVSVIVCTHNRKELVTRAIDSALAQESVQIEVVVVDDCSADNTFEFLEERYGDRIRLIRLEENRRVAYATNRGFENSSGQYIALLGDDDYWTDARKIRKQLDIFNSSGPELGMVSTWWSHKNAEGGLVSQTPGEPESWEKRLLEGGGIIGGSTPLIRRTVWIDAGGLDERLPRGTDSDLFRRVVLNGYKARILKEDTTVIDVGHGLGRMTKTRGFLEAWKIARVHAYILWKYRRQHLKYPGVMLFRVKRLFLGFASATLKTLTDRAPG